MFLQVKPLRYSTAGAIVFDQFGDIPDSNLNTSDGGAERPVK